MRPDIDAESVNDFYVQRHTPSTDSLQDIHRRRDSEASTPTFDYQNSDYQGGSSYEMYPAWVNSRTVPISKE